MTPAGIPNRVKMVDWPAVPSWLIFKIRLYFSYFVLVICQRLHLYSLGIWYDASTEPATRRYDLKKRSREGKLV